MQLNSTSKTKRCTLIPSRYIPHYLLYVLSTPNKVGSGGVRVGLEEILILEMDGVGVGLENIWPLLEVEKVEAGEV